MFDGEKSHVWNREVCSWHTEMAPRRSRRCLGGWSYTTTRRQQHPTSFRHDHTHRSYSIAITFISLRFKKSNMRSSFCRSSALVHLRPSHVCALCLLMKENNGNIKQFGCMGGGGRNYGLRKRRRRTGEGGAEKKKGKRRSPQAKNSPKPIPGGDNAGENGASEPKKNISHSLRSASNLKKRTQVPQLGRGFMHLSCV
jgi:hypothetical protein